MTLPDAIVQDLVETLQSVRDALQRPQTPFDRLLTIQDVCDRWQITRQSYYDNFRDVLPKCAVLEKDPRFRLSDIVRYEQDHMRHADGTPFDPEALKRTARRRAPAKQHQEAQAA